MNSNSNSNSEHIDIISINDDVIKTDKDNATRKINGKAGVIVIVINNKNEKSVLFVRSVLSNLYGMPKGSANINDNDFISCALRELKEETNIEITKNDLEVHWSTNSIYQIYINTCKCKFKLYNKNKNNYKCNCESAYYYIHVIHEEFNNVEAKIKKYYNSIVNNENNDVKLINIKNIEHLIINNIIKFTYHVKSLFHERKSIIIKNIEKLIYYNHT
jgi:8-oxo-dGTP pyrophosphatase MutT (NUDIX family)